MSETKKNHSKWLHIRLKEEEYNKIHKKFEASTCRKLSEYARRILLDKVVTINQRNQSLDAFMAEMIRLRNELHNVENNFNQAVKKLHTLQKIDEFKSWLLLYETTRKMLLEKVENIKQKIAQISDKWLQ
ncbi:plasmid mobilization relaxosome protein MobC [Ilyomonas limi]|uniref:Plasmid mobilization relaxosome protein MobC n=1 Tax=Ilyomonas limi TaxID=2575867 RepID=A0A4V5UTU7_9BACT|nr:plasmid mobilization relaxosome protein MobC [Ilyomonas limi]TKK66363.1 plasmid mobilization relaxosome protein MobC [Ilyomonas limi]